MPPCSAILWRTNKEHGISGAEVVRLRSENPVQALLDFSLAVTESGTSSWAVRTKLGGVMSWANRRCPGWLPRRMGLICISCL